jgi:hypothetical protein
MLICNRKSQRCMYAISLRSDGQAVMTSCGIDLCKPIKANSSLSVSQESVIDLVMVPKNAFVKLSLICFFKQLSFGSDVV